jgi:Matrixin
MASLFGAALAAASACSSPAPKEEHLGIDQSADTGPLGWCRTTTCPPPRGYPTDDACAPPDWSSSATCAAEDASGAPLWWRNACVGYDLDAAASRKVAYDAVSQAALSAFTAWTGASCAGGASSSRVSVDVRDLGAVSCSKAGYDKYGPNQNVVTFHDDAWPYEAADRAASGQMVSPVVALTTVTFDPQSGELFDADVEINSADYDVVPVDGSPNVPADAFDLQAVLTHEFGHFLGLAHSPSPAAVMNASGDADGAGASGPPKRDLRLEDVAAICAVYPPDGTRGVSSIVAASGHVPEGACDPTPHNGLATSCN